MTREDIVQDLRTRVDFCIADANTYIWAKCQQNFPNAIKVGGGNFVVLLSTFSTLDLLSYANGLLNEVSEYSTDEVSDFKKKLNESKLAKFGIKPPTIGHIKLNAKELVKALIAETEVKTGISPTEIDRLWKTRHKLTHEFNPKYIPAGSHSLMPNADYEMVYKQVEASPFMSKGSNNQVCIDVHAFNHKIKIIGDFVLDKIENTDEEIIKKISDWLSSN